MRGFELFRLLRASLFRTWRFRAGTPTGDAAVYLFPNVHAHAARGVRVQGSGRLELGARWKHARFYPSQLLLRANSTIEVGGEYSINTGCSITLEPGAILRLGSGYMNNSGTIECYTQISIGEGVFIGSNVLISDSDQHRLSHSTAAAAPIVIEDHVWIGEGAKILKGVTVGAGSVIAAGAIVTRSVPPRSLAAGIPARVIRQEIAWE